MPLWSQLLPDAVDVDNVLQTYTCSSNSSSNSVTFSIEIFHRISFFPTERDYNLKTNVKFRPLTSANFLSSPKIVSWSLFLLKIFHLPRVSRFRKEDDPAYFESERKHVVVNVKSKESETRVPWGTWAGLQLNDPWKCLWKSEFSILKWYLSICIKTHLESRLFLTDRDNGSVKWRTAQWK